MEAYLKMTMQQISNIVYNGSQSCTKDNMLDSLVNILERYNEVTPNEDKVDINDFRKQSK